MSEAASVRQQEPIQTIQLKEGLYYAGVQDPDLRIFDIIMRTEFGTTYNAYIAVGEEKVVLFETVKERFADAWLDAVKKVADPAKAAYLVVSHTEPDHAGSIERLLDINPGLTIVATACAIGYLKHIVNKDFRSLAVKDGMSLPIGGKTLTFMPLPNLHWPDTMYTYIPEDRALVTCDSFGSHYAFPGVLRSGLADEAGYYSATKYYFDNILGPFKRPYLAKALEKIAPLPIDLILTGHGPVLDSHIDQIMDWYREWTAAPTSDGKKRVAIPYVSAYGYTAQLAREIARGIQDAGGAEVELYDMTEQDQAEVSAVINTADAVLFGTPTILGEALEPIWNLAARLYPPIHAGKLASAFGSYGWGGEGVPHIIERLKQVKMKVIDGLRVRLKPSGTDLQDAFDFGYNFGCTLFNKENDRLKKSAGMMKCLVCGEVFPEGVTVCPVCGVGPDQFIRVEKEDVSYRKDTDERFLILGAGVAGVSAAKAIRARNHSASVVIIGDEKWLPYNRPMLTKNMFGQLSAEQFAINGEKWFENEKITLIDGQRIAAIDPADSIVKLESGARLLYDRCVIALGASSFVPPIPGVDSANVFTIRTLADVGRVEAAARLARRAVVIGGGVLGLETAWELKKFKLDITVIESMPRLLDRKISVGASDMLAGIIRGSGVDLRIGAQVKEIAADNGALTVRLEGGMSVGADMVIVSTGIAPNVRIAQEAGLRVERGIVVDERMRTSVEGVYACGDCAIHDGVRYGLWAEAAAMGAAAGANAAGDDAVYRREAAPVTLNAFGTSLYAIGDSSGIAGKQYKTAEFRDPQKNTLSSYHFLNGRLVGVTLLGDVTKMADALKAVEKGVEFKEMFGR